MKVWKGVFLFTACLLAITYSCRRNQPSLIDRNQAPDTELWYAPPDSEEYEYSVHLYWRGLDRDGRVIKYIWTITDTIVPDKNAEEYWNPSESLKDYRRGRITTRTDSVFFFTAFKNAGGVGLRKNRQAFHVAAIDDNGIIDPEPAEVEFVAYIDKLPEVRFLINTNPALSDELRPYDPSRLDTVGMFRPFEIAFTGATSNGFVRAFKWYSITAGVEVPGADVWQVDTPDTVVLLFTNEGNDTLPNGVFRLAVQCRDDAKAESPVDPVGYEDGVCQVVINFDPDTEIYKVLNTYKVGGVTHRDTLFKDRLGSGEPDTIPYKSWLTIFYRGWDDRDDVARCLDDQNKCISYQLMYKRDSKRVMGGYFKSSWMPFESEDTNPYGTMDSTSMNIGSVEYEILVRCRDEYGRYDGAPAKIEVVGNFDPVLDSLYIVDYAGRKIFDGDTLTWNWNEVAPEFVVDDTSFHWEKTFSFTVRAKGHDHPKELDGSGVKSWYYYFLSGGGVGKQFARARSWVEGSRINELNDTFERTFSYPLEDTNGDTVFENLPWWLGVEYEMGLKGRDTGLSEYFVQYVFAVLPETGESAKVEVDNYSSSSLGRWTEERVMRFYFQMVR